jgi:hypothetical protein
MPDNPPIRPRRVTGTIRRDRLKTDCLERISQSLERLVIAADSIANALSLQALKAHPNKEMLDKLMLSFTPDRRCKHDLRHEDCRECGVSK